VDEPHLFKRRQVVHARRGAFQVNKRKRLQRREVGRLGLAEYIVAFENRETFQGFERLEVLNFYR